MRDLPLIRIAISAADTRVIETTEQVTTPLNVPPPPQSPFMKTITTVRNKAINKLAKEYLFINLYFN